MIASFGCMKREKTKNISKADAVLLLDQLIAFDQKDLKDLLTDEIYEPYLTLEKGFEFVVFFILRECGLKESTVEMPVKSDAVNRLTDRLKRLLDQKPEDEDEEDYTRRQIAEAFDMETVLVRYPCSVAVIKNLISLFTDMILELGSSDIYIKLEEDWWEPENPET